MRLLPDSIRAYAYHLNVKPHWFADSSGFAYHTNTRNGKMFYKVLYSNLKREPAFNRDRMAKALSKAINREISANDLPLHNIRWLNKNTVIFSTDGERFKVDLNGYQVHQLKGKKNKRLNSRISPDENYAVFIKDYNLYLKNRHNGQVTQLSTGGSRFYIYGSYYGWGQLMKGENASPAPNLAVKWSPNSEMILTQIEDARKGKRMYLLDYTVDSLYRPVLFSYFRDSPGDTNSVKYKPVIFNVRTGRMTKIDIPWYPHFLRLNLYWTKDSKHIYGLCFHRGNKKMDVIEVNPQTGKVRTVYTANSKTHVDYKIQFHYLEDRSIAFITSQKSGWRQLYRLNWDTGELQPVTNGNYVVKNILSVDPKNKIILFTATGKKDGVNPYFVSLYKIHFDGSGLKLLTPEPLDHHVYLSPNGKYFIDNRSSARQPTVSLLRSTEDGHIIKKIDSANVEDLLKRGWQFPKVFTVTARDGETTLYGTLWKPYNFDPDREYPVIDFSYTGPQTFLFKNTFTKAVLHSYDSYSPYYPTAQALANLGFIVIQVDGLGTAGRSKAFHQWSYKKMASNLKDHVLAIKQLGKRYSWIDTTRVGIYGHSVGGYDAVNALEKYNDMYSVAVSESGDHDWRMEKAKWTEKYVGWPVGPFYQKQNNIARASQLEGKLLLIHGAMDQNVNPSATYRLVEALMKAGKYFDLLILPSAHHHYLKFHRYVTLKRWYFFVHNLIVDPVE